MKSEQSNDADRKFETMMHMRGNDSFFVDPYDRKHDHSSDSEQDHDQYVDHSDPDSESEFEPSHMRENDSFYIYPGDYLISGTSTTKTSSQQQPGSQLIHTDSLKTSSDIRQCEQDSEVKCGDISPAEKLGSKRSLRASLGGKDKPSDSVDTVNLKLFNTVPSGPKTNFSTMSTPHNQAHIDSLTASPPTVPQKAPLVQFFGVHAPATFYFSISPDITLTEALYDIYKLISRRMSGDMKKQRC